MKIKIKLFVIALFVILANKAIAQKVAFVDTDYILKHMPEYQTAQQQIDELSAQWEKEIQQEFEEIAELERTFEAEQVLLTEAMRRKRESEIVKKTQEAKDLQRKRFGPSGELFYKHAVLIKPIQDKVYRAVEDVAKEGMYAVVFDKKESGILYSNPKFDRSDAVLNKLGIKAGDFASPSSNTKSNTDDEDKKSRKNKE